MSASTMTIMLIVVRWLEALSRSRNSKTYSFVWRLLNFDVCVRSASSNNPMNFSLIKCGNTQEFVFIEDNTIRLKNNKNLCLTVAKGNSRNGGGGSPLHLIRNLTMQICNEQKSIYKTWGIRGFKKGLLFTEEISKFSSN